MKRFWVVFLFLLSACILGGLIGYGVGKFMQYIFAGG